MEDNYWRCCQESNWMSSLDKEMFLFHMLLHENGHSWLILMQWNQLKVNDVYSLLTIVHTLLLMHLMFVQLGFILLFHLVISESPSMHGLPCSSLGCFGNPSDVNTDPAPAEEQNNSRQSKTNHGHPATDPITSQPEALPCSLHEPQHKQPQRTISCISAHSTKTRKINGINSNSDPCFESPPTCRSDSQTSDDDELDLDYSPELKLRYPQIPRPSIIIRVPKVRRLGSVRGKSFLLCLSVSVL